VPFSDLAAQHAALDRELDAAMRRVMDSCAFIRGPEAERFEHDFAAFCNARGCVGVGNGTDALCLALRALGIGPGHEVILPAMTFVATAEAVALVGATPVFADIHPETWTIDPHEVEKRLTPATRAVLPVHLYGLPANMPALRKLTDTSGLALVQDAAQAHGATIHGAPLANFGDCVCFSFFPGKNLGAMGDAGAVCANDPKLLQTVRMLADHGREKKFDHSLVGTNSRLDGLQAAVLGVKLPHLAAWTARRSELASSYRDLLQGAGNVRLQHVPEGFSHVYHLFAAAVSRRDELRAALADAGVATGVHYPRAVPFLAAFAHLGHTPRDFPVAAALQDELVSLPLYPELDPAAPARVARLVCDFFLEARP
jgi:dTDP-4-amino-4,6-dideoxygalactose transaminase